jgi:hypothetical protein
MLILLELTFSLVPGPFLLLASVALKFLHYFLCIEGDKCYLVFWVSYLSSYLPCVFLLCYVIKVQSPCCVYLGSNVCI